jgi:cell division transport system permease protein
MRALRYAFDEAVASLWRGRQSGLLSTATIALALFVLGAFLIITSNLQRLGREWRTAADMSVYLDDDVSPAQRGAIERLLTPGGLVANTEYVSKEAALRRFKETFRDLAAATDGLGDNPLPASYEVRLRTSTATDGDVERLSQVLRQTPGVSDVRYDRQWLDRLIGIVNIVSGIGLVLGAVLTIAAALTVANVVRLALFARRDELEIMQLVGAPQVYIRGPFVVEGVLQGGLGALAAVAVLGAGFLAVHGRYLVPLATAINVSTISFLSVQWCAALVIGGMVVGCLGGLVAAWSRH